MLGMTAIFWQDWDYYFVKWEKFRRYKLVNQEIPSKHTGSDALEILVGICNIWIKSLKEMTRLVKILVQ